MADFPMPGRPSMPAPLTVDARGYCALPPAAPESGEKRSAPGVYSGYTFPKYDGFYLTASTCPCGTAPAWPWTTMCPP